MSRAETDARHLVTRLGLADLSPASVLFWTGAGISFAPPTCGPGGIELVKRAAKHFFEPDVLARLRWYYSKLGIDRKYPRLETVLDVVYLIHGADALRDVLSDLVDAPPNSLHRFFAAHLARGGGHVTANFDTCIEACGGRGVLHFHGSLGDVESALGATLERVQRGFPHAIGRQLTTAITSAETQTIVVAGYSGSDTFDVVPLLRRLPRDSLHGKKVAWIAHPTTDPDGPRKVERHHALLEAAGAAVVEAVADTGAVLEALAAAWGLANATPSVAPRRSEWSCGVVMSDERRWRASLELWAMMGVHREVARLLEARSPSRADELAIAAQTLWSQGRYRAAGERWERAFERADAETRARRAERAGAVLWVQGRLLNAWRTLRRGLDRARADGVDDEPRWLLAEALGHVLVHMRRRPLLRHFVTQARRQLVLDELARAKPGAYDSLGVHLDARFGGVISALGGVARDAESPIVTFEEAEALKAMVSYRHADLRRRAAIGEAKTTDYRRQRAECLALGAFGDAARVHGIPGAGRAFTVAELMNDLRSIELARWPQMLLLARFLLDRWDSRGHD